MNWFKFKGNENELKATLAEAVETALRRTQNEWRKLSDSEKELLNTRRQIEELKIAKDRIEEGNKRERREIEHKIGLEKKRQELELELGKREAVVSVREQNLDADRKRFEEQMRFTQERFEQQFSALKEHLAEITKRLPEINWNIETKHNGYPEKSRRG